jgi:hypothetical protein
MRESLMACLSVVQDLGERCLARVIANPIFVLDPVIVRIGQEISFEELR